MGGEFVAAAIAVKRRKLINHFRQQEAISPASAISPENEGIRKGLIFRKLQRDGVLKDTGRGFYYLDEIAEQARRKRMRIIAFTVILVLMIALLAVLLTRPGTWLITGS